MCVCFGQVKTEEKSNEISAIPELLDLLDLKGMIITIDAMGYQKKNRGENSRKGSRICHLSERKSTTPTQSVGVLFS